MPATLLTLRTRVRQRADKVATQFVTDSEVTAYVNAAASELYSLLAQRRKDWFTISEDETIVSGNTIALNSVLVSRMLYLVGVDYLIGGQYLPLRPYDFGMRGGINSVSSAAGTYRIWYVPEMTLLSADADTLHWSIPQELEEMVVAGACIKIKDKEEADTGVLQAEFSRLRREAEYLAALRSPQGRISDYDGEGGSSRYGSDADRVYRVIGSALHVYVSRRSI